MDSQIIRKHPGGVNAWIKWIKWWLILMLVGGLFMLPITFLFKFFTNPIVEVVKLKQEPAITQIGNYTVKGLSSTELTLEKYNLIDSILFNSMGLASLYDVIFSLIIVWQLYLIFKRLELARPFHQEIPKRIKFIGIVLISISVFTFLRVYYMDHVINELTLNTYKVNYNLYAGDMNSFKVGILVLIIAIIYKQGCRLQQDQDLTI